ncbi:unnamed protein product, partial [Musa acuminata var. zebrina]
RCFPPWSRARLSSTTSNPFLRSRRRSADPPRRRAGAERMRGRGRWGGPWSSPTLPSPKTAHLFPPLLSPLKAFHVKLLLPKMAIQHSFSNWDQIFAINDIAGCTRTSSWCSAAVWLH